MPDLLQLLKPYASDASERVPNANVEIRWPGMSQSWIGCPDNHPSSMLPREHSISALPQTSTFPDLQYIVDTPGAAFRDYGTRRSGGSFNPQGPTAPVRPTPGFIPYSLTTLIMGENEPVGSPMVNTAPRPFTDVRPSPPLDLGKPAWDYHSYTTDRQSTSLAVGSTGASLPRRAIASPAWNPHFENLANPGSVTVYQDAPPTMSQYPGDLVADSLTPEEFKAKAPSLLPGDAGTLIVSGYGLGVLAKTPWVKDFWADRFLQEGLEATSITNRGLNDFIVGFRVKTLGMRAGPIAIGIVVLAILLVLGWLSPRLSMFLERGSAGIGKGVLGIGVGVAVAALALAVLASKSQRGIL